MKRLTPLLLACLASASAAPVTIPFTGTKASETSGDGYAFHIPNLDGIDVNADGTVNYNPLTYPPLPFDPQHPETQLPAGTSFQFGGITYESTAITGSGTETLAVTPAMVAFDFSAYDHAFGYELDVRPPTAGKSILTLSNIAGTGLTFVNGVATSLDFTADVTWQPTLFGTLKQTWTPYKGRVKVSKGTFTFDLSDVPAKWTLGTSDVYFTFDLVVTVDALAPPAEEEVTLPRLSIAASGQESVTLSVHFDLPSTASFMLQESPDLSGAWSDIQTQFTQATAPSPLIVPVSSPARFFRIRTVSPP